MNSKAILDALIKEFPGLVVVEEDERYDEAVNGGDLVEALTELLALRKD